MGEDEEEEEKEVRDLSKSKSDKSTVTAPQHTVSPINVSKFDKSFEINNKYFDIERINPEAFVSTSGSMIGGTITALGVLSETIQKIQEETYSLSKSKIDETIAKRIEPIQKELESTKDQVKTTTEMLVALGGFVETNKNAFVNLISVQGKMDGLEGQVSSINKRVEKLETDKTVNWNKITTISALAVALLSMCCGGVATLAAIIQAIPVDQIAP